LDRCPTTRRASPIVCTLPGPFAWDGGARSRSEAVCVFTVLLAMHILAGEGTYLTAGSDGILPERPLPFRPVAHALHGPGRMSHDQQLVWGLSALLLLAVLLALIAISQAGALPYRY
jgi:hypothetical protein